MSERYKVDLRVGCVAVVDTTIPASTAGLHPDGRHVVAYWSGRRVPKWKKALRLAPDYGAWEVPAPTVRKAERLAAQLNREESTTTPVPWPVKATLLVLLLGSVALIFLVNPREARGQTGGACPPLGPPGCVSGLRCPYPAATVTPQQQRALLNLAGPWILGKDFGAPLPGTLAEYPNAEAWRRDMWDRPYREAIQLRKYCLDPRSGRCGSGGDVLAAAGLILKPVISGDQQPCWSHVGQHARAEDSWGRLYCAPGEFPLRCSPTLGQWLQMTCSRDVGGRWTDDAGLIAAKVCAEGGAPAPSPAPRPVPTPPPPPPVPPPPPPPPSDCEPRETSRWAKKCVELGHPDLSECETWTLANSQSRTVAKLLMVVCPEEPDPPPPPPIETCILCSWDAGQELFRPGAPSTGRLTIELVCVGVECPGEGP